MQALRSFSQHGYVLDGLALGKLSALLTSLGVRVHCAPALHCDPAVIRDTVVRHGVALSQTHTRRREFSCSSCLDPCPERSMGAGVPSTHSSTRTASAHSTVCAGAHAHAQARVAGTKVAMLGRAATPTAVASLFARAARGRRQSWRRRVLGTLSLHSRPQASRASPRLSAPASPFAL